MLFYRNMFFSLIVLPFAKKIQSFVEEQLADRRRRRYLAEFKDFLFMASTAIGAGRSMKDAIGESISSLENIHGKDAALVRDLKKAYERMEMGRENDISVLEEMSEATGLEDVNDFVTIYAICKTSGASLITALNKAAGVIMEKMSIEKEIEELVRRKESEGLIILIMPALVLIFLNLFAPDYIAPMYESLAGRLIMSMTAVGTAAVYMMIRKITSVEI
ncbi:MAG: hypothetical protein IKE52_00380 [Mogibacterium sp.]|nr:hypothetical protein [Mogibacterium sp.]